MGWAGDTTGCGVAGLASGVALAAGVRGLGVTAGVRGFGVRVVGVGGRACPVLPPTGAAVCACAAVIG